MASNIWTAIWGFVAGLVVTALVSYLTPPPREKGLKGLVWPRALAKPALVVWYRSPKFYAAIVIVAFAVRSWRFF